jgi:hypothetical protein
MKEELLNIKLPEKYVEGLIKYEDGIDNVPSWPELNEKGYTWDEHMKLNKLVEIEAMKYTLNSAIDDDELTEEQIKEGKVLIDKAIEEYNEM